MVFDDARIEASLARLAAVTEELIEMNASGDSDVVRKAKLERLAARYYQPVSGVPDA